MQLSYQTITDYNHSRSNTNKSRVCHAPFVNLNFEQNGNVRACCYNTEHILGKWPEQSIESIWFGAKSEALRSYIKNNDLGGGCLECGKMITVGNYQGVRAKYYDEFSSNNPFNLVSGLLNKLIARPELPRVMEFELSNECNLECVMCNGHFSSSIRKNREHLPAIISPYNEKFVDELEPFIPYLTDAKFLGGEPFMIDIYLSIWERIRKINPKIRIHITTNGTFLNNRIKDLLEDLNAGIILSIDSINKDTYAKIRVNGNFEKVMNNLEYFIDYTKRKKTFISIAACPITENWKELPELLEFCLAKNIALYFNAVFTPFELSLREQSIDTQTEILHFLESYPLPQGKSIDTNPRRLSVNTYLDFIKQLKGWLNERKQLLSEKENRLKQFDTETIATSNYSSNASLGSIDQISDAISSITTIENTGDFAKEKELKTHLGTLLIATPRGQLFDAFMAYIAFQNKFERKEGVNETGAKESILYFTNLIDTHAKRDQILAHLASLSPLFFAKWIQENSLETMKENLELFFN